MRNLNEIPSVRLFNAMVKYPPDFEAMEQAVKDGADINMTTSDDGDTLLSDLFYCYLQDHLFRDNMPPNWKTIAKEKGFSGRYLPLIVKFFLNHGFDVKANNGANGGMALYNLIFSSYDDYMSMAARLLLESGADPHFIVYGNNDVLWEVIDWRDAWGANASASYNEPDWDKERPLNRYVELLDLYYNNSYSKEPVKNISFDIDVIGAAVEDYHLVYDDIEIPMYVSGVSGSPIAKLAEALCVFSPTYYDVFYSAGLEACINGRYYPFRIIQMLEEGKSFYEYTYDLTEYGPSDKGIKDADLKNVIELPQNIEISFDCEGASVDWVLDRELSLDNDFNMYIKIYTDYNSEYKNYEFLIPYRKMCKAVAGGILNAFRKYGLLGWSKEAWDSMVDIRYLILLKAIGEGRESELTLKPNGDRQGASSDFEKELSFLYDL